MIFYTFSFSEKKAIMWWGFYAEHFYLWLIKSSSNSLSTGKVYLKLRFDLYLRDWIKQQTVLGPQASKLYTESKPFYCTNLVLTVYYDELGQSNAPTNTFNIKKAFFLVFSYHTFWAEIQTHHPQAISKIIKESLNDLF